MPNPSSLDTLANELKALSSQADSRFRLWENFVNAQECQNVLEVGVFKGEFAEHLLRRCPLIKTYHMLDPWRHLEDWNKPANTTDDVFNEFLAMVREKTAFAKDRVRIHRGTTLEVINEVPDSSIDFAYVDGDHTLQGISIDLHHTWPKVRPGGWLAGDDFCPSIWQHSADYEPTLVFPFAVYFAKAVRAPIFAIGHSQFLIWKTDSSGFALYDLFQSYPEAGLRTQMRPPTRSLENWISVFARRTPSR